MHVQTVNQDSFKGLFYYGVAKFKQGTKDAYQKAIFAFERAECINPKDVDLQYNLALTNLKRENYQQAVDHLKQCIQLDPKHPFAYNNLAFLYNMHSLYGDAI